jgi:hypothetical protein
MKFAVTGHRCVLETARNRLANGDGAPVGVLVCVGRSDPVLGRDARVALRELDRLEGRGQLDPRVVEGAQVAGHRVEQLGLAQLLRADPVPGHEQGDEAGRVLGHGGDLRRDAEPGRSLGGHALRLAIDAERARLLAGQAHDKVGAAEVDAEVAVGDPAFQLYDRALPPAEEGGEPGHHLGQLRDGDLLVHGCRLKRDRSEHLLPPHALVVRDARSHPPSHPVVQSLPGAERHHGAHDRVAPVLHEHQTAGDVAP